VTIESHAAGHEPFEIPADSSSAVARPLRAVLDVRDLPSVVYGSRVVTWWGTVGFMAAETTTLAAVLAAYYYVMGSYTSWPPLRTPPPDLFLPTISLLVLIGALVPTYVFKKAVEKLDIEKTKRWMWIAVAVMLAAAVLRFFEFASLNVRWDANTYASVAWAVLLVHYTLLLGDTLETLLFATIVTRGAPDRYLPGVSEDAMYTFFMVAVWIPCYVTVYLVPRWV
jgi:cytochrome c oxidase subunit 3